MTAYKLVTIQFKWWGLQDRVENFIHSTEKRIFTNFHRQVSQDFSGVLTFFYHFLLFSGVLLDGQVARDDHGGHQSSGGADQA